MLLYEWTTADRVFLGLDFVAVPLLIVMAVAWMMHK